MSTLPKWQGQKRKGKGEQSHILNSKEKSLLCTMWDPRYPCTKRRHENI